MRKSKVLIVAVILLSFLVGIYFYPMMPDKMASHWNAGGEVDGYMPKFWGLFFMPALSVGMFLLFLVIPKIDPLKKNIEKFRKYYDGFAALIILFLFYLYLLTVWWNLGARFGMIRVLAPAFGILLYYTGILTENAKRNWFIGIRTPWTLSSEKVWDKTHKLGGKLFKVAAIVALLGLFFEKYAIWFIIAPMVFIAVFLFVYSFVVWRRERR